MPENPPPQLVVAIAEALGRPLVEALEALGYQLPAEYANKRIDPALTKAAEGLSISAQRRLAALLLVFGKRDVGQ